MYITRENLPIKQIQTWSPSCWGGNSITSTDSVSKFSEFLKQIQTVHLFIGYDIVSITNIYRYNTNFVVHSHISSQEET
jgi:hypothetical protein